MRVFEIRDNTSFERQWTTAVSIHPQSRMVHWSCPECHRGARYPSGAFDVTVEEGTAYPDVLACGAYPLFIVSARVVSAWREHEIGPFHTYPVRVVKAIETSLKPEDAPSYCRVEVCGNIKVDIPASGGKIVHHCLRCGEFGKEPMLIEKFAFLAGSWDGNDLFRDQRLFPRVLFCSEKVKQLAETHQYSNFMFDPMHDYE